MLLTYIIMSFSLIIFFVFAFPSLVLPLNRYKKLLGSVDLTKDFYFSYSYHIMHSLQKNICDIEAGQFTYETMFVWNEFLTREIRGQLNGARCIWTIPLVYGFFKQVR